MWNWVKFLSGQTKEDFEVQRQVNVGSFYMGKYPVTQREYQSVIGSNPSYFKGDTLPVEYVSWFDAITYCNKLSEREGLSPAYTINGSDVIWDRNANGYRLPTEADGSMRAERIQQRLLIKGITRVRQITMGIIHTIIMSKGYFAKGQGL